MNSPSAFSMSANDCSHDVLHVERVRKLALRIARSESRGTEIDFVVVELASLFHDLYDAKYLVSGRL